MYVAVLLPDGSTASAWDLHLFEIAEPCHMHIGEVGHSSTAVHDKKDTAACMRLCQLVQSSVQSMHSTSNTWWKPNVYLTRMCGDHTTTTLQSQRLMLLLYDNSSAIHCNCFLLDWRLDRTCHVCALRIPLKLTNEIILLQSTVISMFVDHEADLLNLSLVHYTFDNEEHAILSHPHGNSKSQSA